MEAIRADRCFDGERFRTDGVTVLVDGEHIAGVEPAAYDVPHGVPVTAYDGTLLPGLVDAHVHLVAESTFPGQPGCLELTGTLDDEGLDAAIRRSLALQAGAGVTTVRDLGDVRYRALVARERHSPGEPRIVAAGPPLTVPGGHCHYLGGVVDGVDELRVAVRDHADRGVDVVKVMASGGMMTRGTDLLGVQFTLAELRVVVEDAHAVGLRVLAHCHSEAGARNAVAAHVDGLEHATLFTEAGIAIPEDLIDEVARAGITLDPTLGLDRDKIAPIEQAPAHVRELVERLGMTSDQVRERRGEQLARMRQAGIRVVSGLDAGVAPPKPHGGLWRAVVQLLDAGYTSSEVLASATSVAADDCDLSGTTGRLRPGLAADLLVVDGDLESDVEALGRPLAVWVRGARSR